MPECQNAVMALKTELANSVTLKYPDPHKIYILDTDCSGIGLGCVLSQLDDKGEERPIAFYSRKINDAEKKYGITKAELLALVAGVRHFKHYLYHSKFIARTDHHSLLWLKSLKDPTGILARWLETLGCFDFTVQHRPGKCHGNADGLSRLLPNETETVTVQSTQLLSKGILATYNHGRLAEAQDKDADISQLKKYLEKSVTPEGNEINCLSLATIHYLQLIDSLVFVDDVVVTQSGSVIVPRATVNDLLKLIHSMDHAGRERLLERIKRNYYCYGMSREVKRYVYSCEACQVTKGKPSKLPNSGNLEYGNPMDQVSIDILGPFLPTPAGNTVVLVAVDHFTRWIEAYPLPDQKAETCARTLYEQLFCRFGMPLELKSDHAPNFASQIMAELCKISGIEKVFSSPFHPQANAMCERFNRTLLQSLRCKLAFIAEKDNWDSYIPEVMAAYRATVHSATKETPNMMMLGRECRIAPELAWGVHYRAPDYSSLCEFVAELQHRLQEVHEQFRNDLLRQPEETSSNTCVNKNFRQGDWVWETEKMPGLARIGKLNQRFKGPYEIIKVLKHDTYVIKLVDTTQVEESGTPKPGKEKVVHHNRLKSYIPDTEENLLGRNNTPHTDADREVLHENPTSSDEPQKHPVDVNQPQTTRQKKKPAHLEDFICYIIHLQRLLQWSRDGQ